MPWTGRRGPGYEHFVRIGLPKVLHEAMLSRDDAVRGLALIKAYEKTAHGSLTAWWSDEPI